MPRSASTFVHVPYRSTTALQDLLTGRIDYTCNFLSTSLAQIEAKELTAIAMLTKTRSPIAPSIPTAAEQGLTDFDAATWSGLFMAKGTPGAIIHKLNEAAGLTVTTASVQAKLHDIGATVVAPERRSPEYLQKFVESEIAKWAEPIRAAGLRID